MRLLTEAASAKRFTQIGRSSRLSGPVWSGFEVFVVQLCLHHYLA
jgi:hypothetical protein